MFVFSIEERVRTDLGLSLAEVSPVLRKSMEYLSAQSKGPEFAYCTISLAASKEELKLPLAAGEREARGLIYPDSWEVK